MQDYSKKLRIYILYVQDSPFFALFFELALKDVHLSGSQADMITFRSLLAGRRTLFKWNEPMPPLLDILLRRSSIVRKD